MIQISSGNLLILMAGDHHLLQDHTGLVCNPYALPQFFLSIILFVLKFMLNYLGTSMMNLMP